MFAALVTAALIAGIAALLGLSSAFSLILFIGVLAACGVAKLYTTWFDA